MTQGTSDLSVSLSSVLGVIIEQGLLDTILMHMEENKVIWDNKYSFTKESPALPTFCSFTMA